MSSPITSKTIMLAALVAFSAATPLHNAWADDVAVASDGSGDSGGTVDGADSGSDLGAASSDTGESSCEEGSAVSRC
jgi:hypothetical protein